MNQTLLKIMQVKFSETHCDLPSGAINPQTFQAYFLKEMPPFPQRSLHCIGSRTSLHAVRSRMYACLPKF